MKSPRLQILLMVSELTPFVKTGGLADMVSALPDPLAEKGHDVRIVLPFYQAIHQPDLAHHKVLNELDVSFPDKVETAAVYRATLPDSDIPVYLIDHPGFFDRAGLYGEGDEDYPDNARRYAFFCQAALWMLKGLEWIPDIVHCNDWQTALAPVYLRHLPAMRDDSRLQKIQVLLTIHNLAYQGLFPAETIADIGLPGYLYNQDAMEFFGKANFLKAGIACADRFSTVSERYAREIQTEEYGCGLEGFIESHADRLSGILNGVDSGQWNPADDILIPAIYDIENMEGKEECRRVLQEHLGWAYDPDKIIIGMVCRLDPQKGIDLLEACLPQIIDRGVRLVILGSGHAHYHNMLEHAAHSRIGEHLRVCLKFDNRLAHLIEAGSDAFLMPSRFEPCGLNQMYSLKYGTVPIVRHTGGLADTVFHPDEQSLAEGKANGFVFERYTIPALLEVIDQALDVFDNKPIVWKQLIHNGMRCDFSWSYAASKYEKLYTQMVANGQQTQDESLNSNLLAHHA